MNSEMIEEVVSRFDDGFDLSRDDLEEIYQEGFEAGQKSVLQWRDMSTAPKIPVSKDLGSTDTPDILILTKDKEIYKLRWDTHEKYYLAISLGCGCGNNLEEYYYDKDLIGWLPLDVLPPAPEVK